MSYHIEIIKLETEKYYAQDHYPHILPLFSKFAKLEFSSQNTIYSIYQKSLKTLEIEEIEHFKLCYDFISQYNKYLKF